MMKLRSFKYQVCRTRRTSQLSRHQFPWSFHRTFGGPGMIHLLLGWSQKVRRGVYTLPLPMGSPLKPWLWTSLAGHILYGRVTQWRSSSLLHSKYCGSVGGRNHARHFTTEVQSVQCRIECIAQYHLGQNVRAHTEQCNLCSWMHMYEHQCMDGGGDFRSPPP